MSACQKVARPLTRSLWNSQSSAQSAKIIRTFTSSSRANEEAAVAEVDSSATKTSDVFWDPNTVTHAKGERALMKKGILPIGSRRRRAAIRTSDNIPFEQLPYQCFQEARKVLQQDREEKLAMIQTERLRISNLIAQDASTVNGGEKQKQVRLDSMRRYLEYLKIQADINDPLIKKRFEDNEGDMNKPIYRFLADRKWRQYQRKIIVQRINQLGIVPDVLPYFEPTAEVKLAFKSRSVHPGEFVDSRVSEAPPKLRVQVFDKGNRLVTVVVMDSDVPVAEEDNFTTRCHYVAANINLSPTQTSLILADVNKGQLALKWLPPFAQKGSPYHRYSVFVLEQGEKKVDVPALRKNLQVDGFNMRSFVAKNNLKPIGIGIFRSLWDDGTAGVMARAGIEGADIEFKRRRVVALRPKEKKRGWEARHASDKYTHLRRNFDYRKLAR